MPLSAWLGSSGAPGEVAGLGPVDADTCRDLASRLATGPGARWCVTLTDADGRAAAHACARAGPGRSPNGSGSPRDRRSPQGPSPGRSHPADQPRTPRVGRSDVRLAWLGSLNFEWLERGGCGHPREGQAYRPSPTLRHLIGRTCECNCSPFCRRHHQTKQAPGWHVDQPEPGTLTWTAPHGRTYIVMPDGYPT